MNVKRLFRSTALGMMALCLGCFAVNQAVAAESRAELTQEARASLQKLYASTPAAKILGERAVGILVFPDILKAGLIVGGSGGDGVLFSADGKVQGYYNVASVSLGLQAGAQNYAETMFFTTPEALKSLESASGWSVGTGPTVVVVDQGAAKDLNTSTLKDGVYAFIYGQQGLMGGIGIQGQKITHLK